MWYNYKHIHPLAQAGMRKTRLRKRSNGRLWLGKMQFSTISGSSKGPSTVGAVVLHTTAFAALLNTVVLHTKSTTIKNTVVLPYCKQCAHRCSTKNQCMCVTICTTGLQSTLPCCRTPPQAPPCTMCAPCTMHHVCTTSQPHCEQCAHLCSTLNTSSNICSTLSLRSTWNQCMCVTICTTVLQSTLPCYRTPSRAQHHSPTVNNVHTCAPHCAQVEICSTLRLKSMVVLQRRALGEVWW